MAKRKRQEEQNVDLFGFNLKDFLTTAPCVPLIRKEVKEWRENDYKGVTATTRELLRYWFNPDGHLLLNNIRFRYHIAQREAIETLIYLYEVKKVRSRKDLLEKYAFQSQNLRLPPYDDFARYCIKMATGSGKTKVMALAIAWQYFNAVRENEKEYAKTFLVLAPNVIVFERLKTDFENGKVFREDPLFPRHFQLFWDMDFYMRGDGERTHCEGALYLTNIQQFYDRSSRTDKKEPEIMTAMLGSAPPTTKLDITDFDERIAQRDGLLMVLNDEAHHTHEEDNQWNKVIRRLHESRPIAAQLDYSATPRYSGGGLFAWTTSDYPLKQAILDGIVKRPIKGISHIEEAKSNDVTIRYKGFLVAAVERWKEYKEQLQLLGKKPILFVMMTDTGEADAVGGWLQTTYPELFAGDKTLVIHTDKSGEVSKKDLETARKLARDVDKSASPVNAIVSVLMLREGWDVQNVTVVVGLRPYSAQANILPEQTIGRGLRLMFRNLAGDFSERVDIIGNKAFISFVEELERLEDIKLDTFEIGKDKLKIVTIQPEASKMEYDIAVPELSAILERKKSLAEEIDAIDVMAFDVKPIPTKRKEIEALKSFVYEGRDILTDEKLFEKTYSVPEAQTAEEIIGYYARMIAANIKLPSQFSAIAPKIKAFFQHKIFGKEVDLQDPNIVEALNSNLVSYVVTNTFEKALREMVVEEKQPTLLNIGKRLSETKPFPFSRPLLEAKHTVFNYAACDNEYEKAFAKFLDTAKDVAAFAKLPPEFGFYIHYTDKLANLRNYFPDFVARLEDGSHWIIETKGREDVDVAAKDEAAKVWCEKATDLTGINWNYVKVLQTEFEKLHPDEFRDLVSVFG